jgi:hypothetical protein
LNGTKGLREVDSKINNKVFRASEIKTFLGAFSYKEGLMKKLVKEYKNKYKLEFKQKVELLTQEELKNLDLLPRAPKKYWTEGAFALVDFCRALNTLRLLERIKEYNTFISLEVAEEVFEELRLGLKKKYPIKVIELAAEAYREKSK